MNDSAAELFTPGDEELVERALPLLPEICKRLFATKVQHPVLATTSMAQVKAMMHVAAHGRRTVGEIAGGLGLSMPAASELVDRLVEAGLRIQQGQGPAPSRPCRMSRCRRRRAGSRRGGRGRRSVIGCLPSRAGTAGERPAILGWPGVRPSAPPRRRPGR